jgi:hypothetical protein
MSSSPEGEAIAARFEAAAREASAAAESALASGSTAAIADAPLQQLIVAGARLYARKLEEERRALSPLPSPDALTATEAAELVTEILRAVDLNLFDLAMWAGRPRQGAAGT